MSTDDGEMDVGMLSPAASGPDVAALGDALEPAPEAVDLQARPVLVLTRALLVPSCFQ